MAVAVVTFFFFAAIPAFILEMIEFARGLNAYISGKFSFEDLSVKVGSFDRRNGNCRIKIDMCYPGKEPIIIDRVIIQSRLAREGWLGLISWVQLISALFRADKEGLETVMGAHFPYFTAYMLVPIYRISIVPIWFIVAGIFGIIHIFWALWWIWFSLFIMLFPIPLVFGIILITVFKYRLQGPYCELLLETNEDAVELKDDLGTSWPTIPFSPAATGGDPPSLSVYATFPLTGFTNKNTFYPAQCTGYSFAESAPSKNPWKLPSKGEFIFEAEHKLILHIVGKHRRFAKTLPKGLIPSFVSIN